MAVGLQIMVGMSELKIAKGRAVLTCLGLGSCIGVVAHDPLSDVTGVVHIMLPEAFKDRPVDKPGKFVDTALPELIKALTAQGADAKRLLFTYAGGAQVFKFGSNSENRLDVGARNCLALAETMAKLGIKPIAIDVGGTQGRTVTVDTETGNVVVRTVHSGEKTLCNLKSQAGRVAA